MTARFSSASSAGASPVVPSATMPATPSARYSPQRRSIASTSTAPDVSNGVMSGTQTPWRSRIARHARKRTRRPPVWRRRDSVPEYPPPSCPPCSSSRSTVAVGFVSGVLSGMFGIGGAVVTTPAIRVLGATTFQAIGSTLPSILPSSISGSLRYNREHLIRGRIVLITSAFGVPASVVGSRLSRSVPGNGHWLMIATARARRLHRVPHRVPGRARRRHDRRARRPPRRVVDARR